MAKGRPCVPKRRGPATVTKRGKPKVRPQVPKGGAWHWCAKEAIKGEVIPKKRGLATVSKRGESNGIR